TNINIIARRTGKDVNSHTVLDGIITTIMATIQRINIIGSREGSRNRRRLKANQTGKKFRVGIKSNISTNRNNLISGVDRCIHLNAMKKTTITSINRHPIAVRYTQDAFSRSGWLWPVDAKGEPLKATSYMAVGFYVAKYVNKKSDMDLAAKGLGAKEWNNSLKTKLSLLPKKLFR